MLLATDPKNVSLCLDVHWVYRGSGNSQVALFDIVKLYGKRIAELHLRQSKGGIWQETFTEGDIDYPRLVQMLDGLGVKLARRYPDRVTFDFFGDQLVCHLSDQVPAEAVAYPRHFGVTFARREDFDHLVRVVEFRKLPVLDGPSLRFA